MAETGKSCGEMLRLGALLEGRLGAVESAVLEAHLEGCEACRQAFDGLAAGNRWWSELRRFGRRAIGAERIPGSDSLTALAERRR